jgi:hypothetical protein
VVFVDGSHKGMGLKNEPRQGACLHRGDRSQQG